MGKLIIRFDEYDEIIIFNWILVNTVYRGKTMYIYKPKKHYNKKFLIKRLY